MAKERITHSICVGGPLTIHTVDGVIRRVRPIVLTDDDAPGWVIKAHGNSQVRAIFCAIRQARTVVTTGVVDLIREGVAQLVRAGEVLARGLLAQVIGHAHGKLAAHVAHHERVLEVLPEVLVDLAAHVEELVHGLARAGEAMLQPVKKSHLRHRPPFL